MNNDKSFYNRHDNVTMFTLKGLTLYKVTVNKTNLLLDLTPSSPTPIPLILKLYKS